MARLKTTTFDGGLLINKNADTTYNEQKIQESFDSDLARQSYIHIFDIIYPVGCIYQSTNPTNPKEVFGFGKWEQIKGKFLYAKSADEEIEEEGGRQTISLSSENIPNHKHKVKIPSKKVDLSATSTHSHAFPGGRSFAGIPKGASLSGECVGRIHNGSWRMAQIDFKDGGYTKVSKTAEEEIKWNSSFTIGGDTATTTEVLDSKDNIIYSNNSDKPVVEQQPINIMPPYKAIYAWERKE